MANASSCCLRGRMTGLADFKLHAPYQTTVEGHVEHGKITQLKTVPAYRAKDVVVAVLRNN